MTTSASPTRPGPMARGWVSQGEAWLDERGKGAWIAAMVVAFILFWPLGLALLAYMIWSKRMFTRTRHTPALQSPFTRRSGNSAFDAYKADTLRRLQDEQDAFEAFLDRLRAAKDQAEFDQFLSERARPAKPGPDSAEA